MAQNERVGGIEFEAEVDLSKVDDSGKRLDASLGKLEAGARKAEKALTGVEKSGKAAAGSISALEKEAQSLRQRLDTLAPGTQKFIDTARKLTDVERRLKDVRTAADAAGQSSSFLQSTFARLTGAFTAANLAADLIRRGVRLLASTFIDSVKNAMEFETILARISTVVEGSTKPEIQALGKEVIALSKRFPKSKEELGVGLYNILQAGIENTSDAMKILEISTKAAIGGVTDVGTATKVVTNIMGAYNLTADEAVGVMDAVFVGAQRGKAEFSDLAGSMGNVLQSAAQLNVGVPEVVAAIETMVNAGLSADEASTSLNAFFTSVIQTSKGTGEAFDEAKRLGLEFDSTALRTKGLRKFMEDLSKAVGDDEVAMQILSGNVRGFRAAASIGGKGAEFFTDTLDAMGEQTGAVDAAFQKMADTTESRVALAINAASNQAGIMGAETLPAVNRILEVFTDTMNAATPVAVGLGTALGVMLDGIRIAMTELPTLIPGLKTALNLALSIRALLPKGSAGTPDEILTGTIGSSTDTGNPKPKPNRGGGGEGKDALSKAKDLLKEIDRIEKDIIDAVNKQIDANKKRTDEERDHLEIKAKLGIITDEERKRLDMINKRVAYQKDAIDIATKAWEEQKDKVEDLKKTIKELNDDIVAQAKDTAKKLADIDKETNQRKAEKIADLLAEQADLEKKLANREGLSSDDQNRLAKIKETLQQSQSGSTDLQKLEADLVQLRQGPGKLNEAQQKRAAALEAQINALKANPDIFAQGQAIFDLNQPGNELQAIDAEGNQKKKDVAQEANDKLSETTQKLSDAQSELREAEASLTAAAENVSNAIIKYSTTADTQYSMIQKATEAHVNHEIPLLDDLKSHFDALADSYASVASYLNDPLGLGNSQATAPGFAAGGPISGPGTGTSDSITARLSNGEHVLTAKDVVAMGGQRAVLQFRHDLHRMLPRFAEGGPVTHDNSKRAEINVHNHGEAAKAYTDPRRARWLARTFF